MKSKIMICLCFFVANLAFGQSAQISVKYSEPFAVYKFVEAIRKESQPNSLKVVFEQSPYAIDKYRHLLDEFSGLELYRIIPYENYPRMSKLNFDTQQLLEQYLVESSDMQAFKRRSIGVVENTTLFALVRILDVFTPIYKELIYQPNKVMFEQKMQMLQELTAAKGLGRLFMQGVTFYKSDWDLSIPFHVAFYVLPNDKYGFNGGATYNAGFSSFPIDFNETEVLLGVMMHEVYHVVYDEQNVQTKKWIHGVFQSSQAKGRVYAYGLLNEVLATAMGNGYVYAQLTGVLDKSSWYNNKYINVMARQIYPTVKEYMENGKPLDEAFIHKYIELHDKQFSQWSKELKHLMTYRSVLSDNEQDFEAIASRYPYSSSSSESTFSAEHLEKIKLNPHTKVIFVSSNHSERLALVKKIFPDLAGWKYKSKQEFIFTQWLSDGTRIIVINQYKSATTELLDQVEKQIAGE